MNVDNRIESLTPEAQIVCRRWLNVIADHLQLEESS